MLEFAGPFGPLTSSQILLKLSVGTQVMESSSSTSPNQANSRRDAAVRWA